MQLSGLSLQWYDDMVGDIISSWRDRYNNPFCLFAAYSVNTLWTFSLSPQMLASSLISIGQEENPLWFSLAFDGREKLSAKRESFALPPCS